MRRRAVPRLSMTDGKTYYEWRRIMVTCVECSLPGGDKARALRTLVRRYPGYVLLGLPDDVVDWCRLHRETVEKMGS